MRNRVDWYHPKALISQNRQVSLGVCSGLFLVVVLKKEERSLIEIILVSLATVISFASGIYQIFA